MEFVGKLCLHIEIDEWMKGKLSGKSMKNRMIAAILLGLSEIATQHFYYSARYTLHLKI